MTLHKTDITKRAREIREQLREVEEACQNLDLTAVNASPGVPCVDSDMVIARNCLKAATAFLRRHQRGGA